MTQDPAQEYRIRLALRQAAHARLTRTDGRLAYLRLATFAIGALLVALVWSAGVSVAWLILPTLLFATIVVRHDRVRQSLESAERAIVYYERGLARLEDRWIGTGETGDRFRDDSHPFANDLDLFGRGSLFELVSIATTRGGEETLAGWLTCPAEPDEVHARQEAVTELTPALDLREEVVVAGTDVRTHVDTQALVTWAEAPPVLTPTWLRPATVVMTCTTVGTVSFWVMTQNYVPMLVALAIQTVVQRVRAARVKRVLHTVDGPARNLAVLHRVARRLESESFFSPRLSAIRREFQTDGVRASTAIRRLERLVEMHDWEHNLMFAPIAGVLMWGTHVAWAIERWRRRYGRHIAAWLRAVGEFEALSSLSAYRFEHPADPFPSLAAPLIDPTNGRSMAGFDGVSLGHPLLPVAKMVPNDVDLSGQTRVLVVSGSNMSGKSTLLRTVGVNAVLGLMGAPVRARSLRLTPLAIGATLRIQDSLVEGRSRFFAEITRVRLLADLANGPRPLLFLLDELFHGTNSHDRLVGASGVLRSLIDRGAIGLVTTHDLALTAVADKLAPRAANVHFEDRFEGGEMRFDYRMKAGPVTHSNAVALMRAVGLDVEGT